MDSRLPIRVLTEGGSALQRPTRRELARVFERMIPEAAAWITGNGIPRLPNVFLQAALEPDGGFLVEWRDGGPRILAARVSEQDRVIALFADWALQSSDWDTGVEWSDSGFEAPAAKPVAPDARAAAEASASRAIREGYWTFDEVRRKVQEESETGPPLDAAQTLAILAPLWTKAVDEQRSWATQTDCDRLEDAFTELNAAAITARANVTCCQTCGTHEIREDAGDAARGHVFFHHQDLATAAGTGSLMLSYGSASNTEADTAAVGREVVTALRRAGLTVEWDGDPGTRIEVVDMNWRKRLT